MIDNKITIKGDPVVDAYRSSIGHRATWTGLTYVMAKEAGKAEEFETIIRQAVTETGRIQGSGIKARCQNPQDVSNFADTFLKPKLMETFEVEYISKDKDKVDIAFHHCPLLKAWQELGFSDEDCEKLCDMAMDGDRSIAKTMGYQFDLGDTIAKGCKTCRMAYYK